MGLSNPDPVQRQRIRERTSLRILGWCELGRHVNGTSQLPACPGSTPTGTVCQCECHTLEVSP